MNRNKISRLEERDGSVYYNIQTEISMYMQVLYILFIGCLFFLSLLLEAKSNIYKIFPLVIGIFCIKWAYHTYSNFSDEYIIHKDGIIAKYSFKTQRLIPWDAFQQVCVCYGNYNKSGSAYVYICCVKKGQKKNFYGRWPAGSIFRQRSVISIDYSDDLHKEIQEKCPYEVLDLRNTRAYRL